ncbi:excisionase family DNA-binding protein [Actinoplanes sp. NPDC051343]|uniref:excisionase family DNA-binding protein n=1 Tax=Actinoplanes sp. NPDC051343 TaxID=3363906 RepID=UPI0037961A69
MRKSLTNRGSPFPSSWQLRKVERKQIRGREHRKALYTVREAAEQLNLSRSQIYELIRSGRLRTVKEGRARRVPAAIDAYVGLLIRESEGRQAA